MADEPTLSADYERAVEHATDALEVFFGCEAPIELGLKREWIEGLVRMTLDAALPHLDGGGADG